MIDGFKLSLIPKELTAVADERFSSLSLIRLSSTIFCEERQDMPIVVFQIQLQRVLLPSLGSLALERGKKRLLVVMVAPQSSEGFVAIEPRLLAFRRKLLELSESCPELFRVLRRLSSDINSYFSIEFPVNFVVLLVFLLWSSRLRMREFRIRRRLVVLLVVRIIDLAVAI